MLLDTNVLSEVMRAAPEPRVLRWLNGQVPDSIWIPVIAIAEIACGLRNLPDGRRRTELRERFERFLSSGFEQRILDFDVRAAFAYGEIMAVRREKGRAVSVPDGQIAAIARSRNLCVATRNVTDFTDCGVRVVNPWTDSA